MDFKSLLSVSQSSKALYIYSQTEELWKELVLDNFWDEATNIGNFTFQTSWKSTFVHEFTKHEISSTTPFRFGNLFSDSLYNRWYCNEIDPSYWEASSPTARSVDVAYDLSIEDFVEKYEKLFTPVIIKGVVSEWPAFKEWQKKNLLEKYPNVVFKTDQAVHLKLADYFAYCENVKESNPMYLFDNQFCDKIPQFGNEYEVGKKNIQLSVSLRILKTFLLPISQLQQFHKKSRILQQIKNFTTFYYPFYKKKKRFQFIFEKIILNFLRRQEEDLLSNGF